MNKGRERYSFSSVILVIQDIKKVTKKNKKRIKLTKVRQYVGAFQ